MAHQNTGFAATCHCGSIRIYVRKISRTLTSCNCSICRRYGALWAYSARAQLGLELPTVVCQSIRGTEKFESIIDAGNVVVLPITLIGRIAVRRPLQ
jgi:hypothetical protein